MGLSRDYLHKNIQRKTVIVMEKMIGYDFDIL